MKSGDGLGALVEKVNGIAGTGYLVALANSRDRHHAWAMRVSEQVTEPLLKRSTSPCWPSESRRKEIKKETTKMK